MSVSLIFTEKAEADLDEAYVWYEEQEPGLGKEFVSCIDDKINSIISQPLQHPAIVNKKIRRALVNRFPFSIYFEIDENLVTVFAILHQSRNPSQWKSRV